MLRAYDNKVLRRIFGPKREEDRESYIMRDFTICFSCNFVRVAKSMSVR